MGAPAMELLNTLSIHASASGRWSRDFVGSALREAQCEPVQGQWNHVPRRPDGRRGAVETRFQRRRPCAFC
jgi:hypothetical protein